MAERRQLFGQAPHDVGDATLLGEGHRLGRDQQNLQPCLICHVVLVYPFSASPIGTFRTIDAQRQHQQCDIGAGRSLAVYMPGEGP